MKVTKQTLPLFNEMYELKFSEEEMAKAFSVQEGVAEKLKDLGKPFKSTSVGALVHVIDNSVNSITHTMYVSDTWNGRLEIHAGKIDEDEDDDESTGEESENKKEIIPLKTTSHFEFTPDRLTPNHRPTVKVKTIDPELFYTLLDNLHYCKGLGIIPLNKLEEIKLESEEMLEDLSWLVEVTSGPKVLQKLKDGELNTNGGINTTKEHDEPSAELQAMCEWLMPNAKKTETPDDKLEKKLLNISTGNDVALAYIEAVFEQDNYRLGVFTIYSKDYYRATASRKLFLLGHEDDLFNYADVDRISLLNRNRYYRYNNANPLEKPQLLGNILFTEEVTLPTIEAIAWIVRHATDNNTQLYDSSALKLSVKKFTEEIRREKEDEVQKKLLESKLKEKIDAIKTGKKLILNGMTITKTSISYEGQALERKDKVDWVHDLLLGLSRAYKFDDINWDSLFEAYISTVSSTTSAGRIGDVTFGLKYETSVNRVNIESTKTYLNDFRINKQEITDCLRRAVCYTTQEDFDEFISNVSSCSLRFHRYLQTGVDFEVSGMRHGEGFAFKLPLERRKNLMYIVLGDNEYKVRDTNKLLNMQNLRDLGEIMELLLADKVIEGMTIDDAKSVLRLAKIEFQDAIDKSKKLLEETEKTLKLIKQENIQMNEISVREGYIVNGKLRQYVVANTEKCEVYEYPSGRYICIVDKSTSQVGKDKLINRLYALTNDQALAQDIHTLN